MTSRASAYSNNGHQAGSTNTKKENTLSSAYARSTLSFFKKLLIGSLLLFSVVMTSVIFVSFYLASAPANTPMYYMYHASSYAIRYYTGETINMLPQMTISGRIMNATWSKNTFWIKMDYVADGVKTHGWFNLANVDVIPEKKDGVIAFFRANRGPFTAEVYFERNMKQVLLYGADGSIINLDLIELDFALPSKNPITRKIDKIFSDYYLGLAGVNFNKKKEQ